MSTTGRKLTVRLKGQLPAAMAHICNLEYLRGQSQRAVIQVLKETGSKTEAWAGDAGASPAHALLCARPEALVQPPLTTMPLTSILVTLQIKELMPRRPDTAIFMSFCSRNKGSQKGNHSRAQ